VDVQAVYVTHFTRVFFKCRNAGMSASGQSSTGMNNIADAGTSPVPELFARIHIITSTSKKI
jgi:hypothetical protein